MHRTLCVIAIGGAPLFAQEPLRHSLSLSGGYTRQIAARGSETPSTYLLGGSYGYRFHANFQADLGLHFAPHPTPSFSGRNFTATPSDLFVWLPFGLRGVLPLSGGRLELSAGGGGLYQRYKGFDSPPTGLVPSRNGWGGYATGGLAFALDRGRRFWLGASPRFYLANSSGFYDRNRWLAITGDFSIRF